MHHYWKPIRLSLRYKWTLLASMLNALIIGVLWGVSMTTVYPFVEVVFQGQTVDTWLENELDAAQRTIAASRVEVAQVEADLASAEDAPVRATLSARLDLAQSRLQVQQRKADFYAKLQPRLKGMLPTTPFGTLLLLMMLLVAATLLKGGCLVLNVVLVARVAGRTVMDMRRIFYRAALQMDQQQFDRIGTTALMTQLSHNINLVNTGLKSLYGQSVREPLKMLACLVGAALISWQLLVLSLLIAPLGAFSIHYLSQRMKRSARKEMGGMAAVFQTLIETFNGIKVVRIFNRERRERRRFRDNSAMLYRLSMKMSFFDSLVKPITETVGVLSLVVAILAGAYLVLNQQTHLFGIPVSERPLSPSALFVFFAMLAGISGPARKMGDIYNILVRAAVASESLYTSFQSPPRVVAQPPVQRIPILSRSIRLENVSFEYQPDDRVLHHINLEIPFGQCVVLVGENGSGKTTLVNLITRFYDPVEGNVYWDDVNMCHLNPRRIRKQISMVSQDPTLFRGTIRDNILYGNPHADREHFLDAVRLARVDSFAKDMKFQLRSQVGDQGKSLSGGQRQRVTLARAILASPRLLILDEATSQFDRDAEASVHDGLRDFLKNRTSILITHRRSTVVLADRVIVLDRGRIVADLAPQEYLAQNTMGNTALPVAA